MAESVFANNKVVIELFDTREPVVLFGFLRQACNTVFGLAIFDSKFGELVFDSDSFIQVYLLRYRLDIRLLFIDTFAVTLWIIEWFSKVRFRICK